MDSSGTLDGRAQSHLLVLNKIDLLTDTNGHRNGAVGGLEETVAGLMQSHPGTPSFDDIMHISALCCTGIDRLKSHVLGCAVDSPWLYDKDLTTDQSVLKQVEEEIREQLFLNLRKELPYKVFQRNITCTENKDGSLSVCQAIVAQRKSQKSIIIGKSGSLIKQIEEHAEEAISNALQRPVALKIIVMTANKRDSRMYQ